MIKSEFKLDWSKLSINLKNVMILHAIFCLCYGVILVVLPHGFYKHDGQYNYLVHESSRVSSIFLILFSK